MLVQCGGERRRCGIGYVLFLTVEILVLLFEFISACQLALTFSIISRSCLGKL